MKIAINKMIKDYEAILRKTTNISIKDILEQIIEDLNILKSKAETKK